ncbi:MAG: DUF4397 domain-containing protein [Gammaproteobacteria bacterium]
MRRILKYSVICLAVGALSACDKPALTIATENIPTAGVRFINAVPDSAGGFGLDMRFVDIVESNAQFRITFRNGPAVVQSLQGSCGTPCLATDTANYVQVGSGQTQYKGARAGSRHFVIFLDDTAQTVASTIIKDTTVTLEAGKNYTALLWGAARTGGSPAMKLTFMEEAVPDPGANIAMRVINTTAQSLDARFYARPVMPNKDRLTPTAGAADLVVPAQSVSTYVTKAPGNWMVSVRNSGTATNFLAEDIQAFTGTAAFSSAGTGGKIDINANPGASVAGSAMTFVVYPRSTAGSKAPQITTSKLSMALTAGVWMWDRRPALVPGT